jgi:hypothetical protein
MTLQFSSSMKTLRDRYGVNEIDPSEIKTVKKLGTLHEAKTTPPTPPISPPYRALLLPS